MTIAPISAQLELSTFKIQNSKLTMTLKEAN